MKVVYIAGPFRGSNHWEIEQNIRCAEALALEVWRAGYAVICPHTNTRFFDGAAPDDIWLNGDLELVRRCDAVLMTPDWKKSKGATAEMMFAMDRQIPVFYSLEELTKGLPALRPDSWRRQQEAELRDVLVDVFDNLKHLRQHGRLHDAIRRVLWPS